MVVEQRHGLIGGASTATPNRFTTSFLRQFLLRQGSRPPAEGECVAMHMGTGSVDCEALETFMDLMVVCVAFCEIWATFYPPAAVLLVFFLAWLAAAALLHAFSC
jgi:hypothetical protein